MTEIMGIVNGTTNYILTKMSEEGMGYQEALDMATRLGYAEADPTADVEGYDAVSYTHRQILQGGFHVRTDGGREAEALPVSVLCKNSGSRQVRVSGFRLDG